MNNDEIIKKWFTDKFWDLNKCLNEARDDERKLLEKASAKELYSDHKINKAYRDSFELGIKKGKKQERLACIKELEDLRFHVPDNELLSNTDKNSQILAFNKAISKLKEGIK